MLKSWKEPEGETEEGSAMKTKSLLVSFPGNPFDPKMLLPRGRLATVASCLLEAGHETQVWDYGTVCLIERLFSGESWEPVRQNAESLRVGNAYNPFHLLRRVWQKHAAERAFLAHLAAACRDVSRALAAEKEVNFIAFDVSEPSDWSPAVEIANQVKAQAPHVRTLALGPFVESFYDLLLDARDGFDGLCLGDPESVIREWAEQFGMPNRWAGIPNVIWRHVEEMSPVRRKPMTNLGMLPPPAYSRDVYRALDGDQKVKLFEVEESRGCTERCHGCGEAILERPYRIKPPHRIGHEISSLVERHGARVLRLSGQCSSWEHVNATAQAIMAHGLNVAYGRKGPVQWALASTFPLLRASGCVAMEFRVDTGSQRLLDNHYGRGFGISHVEHVFRACKAAGMMLGVQMTYPCAEDDYHTTAETLRLIRRTKPALAEVNLPEVTARTAWHARSAEFGYQRGRRSYLKRLTRLGSRLEAELGGWQTPTVEIRGLSTAQIIGAHEDLVLAIEEEGVVTCCSQEVALLARLSGYDGREGELAGLIHHHLLTGDAESLAEFVALFNREACVPRKTAAFVPFAPVPLAVGN